MNKTHSMIKSAMVCFRVGDDKLVWTLVACHDVDARLTESTGVHHRH